MGRRGSYLRSRVPVLHRIAGDSLQSQEAATILNCKSPTRPTYCERRRARGCDNILAAVSITPRCPKFSMACHTNRISATAARITTGSVADLARTTFQLRVFVGGERYSATEHPIVVLLSAPIMHKSVRGMNWPLVRGVLERSGASPSGKECPSNAGEERAYAGGAGASESRRGAGADVLAGGAAAGPISDCN